MFLPTQAMLVWKCLELILHGTCRYYFFASNYFQGHPGPFTKSRCSVSAATSIAPPFLSPKTDSPRTLRGGWLKHLQTVLRAAPSALVLEGRLVHHLFGLTEQHRGEAKRNQKALLGRSISSLQIWSLVYISLLLLILHSIWKKSWRFQPCKPCLLSWSGSLHVLFSFVQWLWFGNAI